MGEEENLEVVRIYFMRDVEDLGEAHRCSRCGHKAPTIPKMYEHRKGLVSRCLRSRMKQWVRRNE